MSNPSDLEKRLRFFGIDSQTRRTANAFLPVMLPKIETFAEKFYGHTLNFPEARRILEPHYKNKSLRDRQVKHWIRLFSCRFDQTFFDYALKIGQVHYEKRVFPYLYIGGYTFIQCELTELAAAHYSDADMCASVLATINRLIALDMDLALSAYTREHWLQNQEPKKSSGISPRGKDNTILIC